MTILPATPEASVKDAKPKLKKPRLYKVVMLNDDFTPMEFVVNVLRDFFNLKEEIAVQIMLSVHQAGRGVCGQYSREVAEMKVKDVHECAQRHQYPLQCILEPE